MVPRVAYVACPSGLPADQRVGYFENKLSANSARGRLRQHFAHLATDAVYAEVEESCPEHLHTLPSILTALTSQALVAACHGNPRHRLTNSVFSRAMLRKLCLPIFDPKALPRCWCGS